MQEEKLKRNGKRGFTLIELIVVMAILAILVLLAAPRFIGKTEDARVAQIMNDIKVAETKVGDYLIAQTDLDEWGNPIVSFFAGIKPRPRAYHK